MRAVERTRRHDLVAAEGDGRAQVVVGGALVRDDRRPAVGVDDARQVGDRVAHDMQHRTEDFVLQVREAVRPAELDQRGHLRAFGHRHLQRALEDFSLECLAGRIEYMGIGGQGVGHGGRVRGMSCQGQR